MYSGGTRGSAGPGGMTSAGNGSLWMSGERQKGVKNGQRREER